MKALQVARHAQRQARNAVGERAASLWHAVCEATALARGVDERARRSAYSTLSLYHPSYYGLLLTTQGTCHVSVGHRDERARAISARVHRAQAGSALDASGRGERGARVDAVAGAFGRPRTVRSATLRPIRTPSHQAPSREVSGVSARAKAARLRDRKKTQRKIYASMCTLYVVRSLGAGRARSRDTILIDLGETPHGTTYSIPQYPITVSKP